jgi:hypothetical protein
MTGESQIVATPPSTKIGNEPSISLCFQQKHSRNEPSQSHLKPAKTQFFGYFDVENALSNPSRHRAQLVSLQAHLSS